MKNEHKQQTPPRIELILEQQKTLSLRAKERVRNLFKTIKTLPQKQGWFLGVNPESIDFLRATKTTSALFQALEPYKKDFCSFSDAYQDFWEITKKTITQTASLENPDELWNATYSYSRKKISNQVDRIPQVRSSEDKSLDKGTKPSMLKAVDTVILTLAKTAMCAASDNTPYDNPLSLVVDLYSQGFVGTIFEETQDRKPALALYHPVVKDGNYFLNKIVITSDGVIKSAQKIAWESVDLRLV